MVNRSRRRRPSPVLVSVLIVAIMVMLYVNQVVVPTTGPLFIPTPTPTLSPEAFISQAEGFYREGKIEKAIEAYQEAVYTDPANASTYVALARLQVFAGRYDEAIVNTQNALLQNPDNPLAHAVQGWAFGFQEKYGEAELAVKKAISEDPNNALAHAYYAEILINQGQYDLMEKAIEESNLARSLDPTLLEVHRARGLVLLNTQNLAEAVQEFQAALAINKNIADLHLNLGVTYRLLEDYDRAQEALLAAYALNPSDTVALSELAAAFFADGRYAQAAQYAEEAVRVDPTNPRMHGNLGIMYYKNQEFSKAIPELRLAIQGGTTENGDVVEGMPLDYGKVVQFYWYYGFALTKSERCAEAVPVFQALIEGVPDDEIAQYNAQEGLAACKELLEGGGGTSTGDEATPEATAEGETGAEDASGEGEADPDAESSPEGESTPEG